MKKWKKNRAICFMGVLSCALLCPCVLADGIVVVDNRANGYLYSPSEDDLANRVEEISLHLVKEGGFTQYRIESDPPGLLCDESCAETVQRIPAGSVKLKIIGNKPFPLLKIPLLGEWKEGCDGTRGENAVCVMNLNANNAKVVVEVSPNVDVGTVFPAPDGVQQLMLLKIDTGRGYAVAGSHLNISPPLQWLVFDPRNPTRDASINIKSWDGIANTEKLRALRSPAADYCRVLEENFGGKWHVPSKVELSSLTAEVMKKKLNLSSDDEGRLWSSTQGRFSETGGGRGSEKSWQLSANALNNGASWDDDRYVYTCSQATLSCKNERKHRVLCVTHLPL